MQGWAIALFEKERITLFVKSKRAIRSLSLFLKERKSKTLFCALLEKKKKTNSTYALFLKRAKEPIALFRSF